MQEKRVALVTGANKGIGLQIAKDLAKHDLIVLVGARKSEDAQSAAKSVERTLMHFSWTLRIRPRFRPQPTAFRTSLGDWTFS